jgi:DNA-binding NarL/FixJ family response regulator
MTARVLIVDDHPLTREALAGLLTANDFEVVGQASGGAEAIGLAGELEPALIVLDLTMPDMSGLEALPLLRAAAPAAEVVVLTAAEDDANLLAAIRGGAAGYLLKSEPSEKIVAFLRGVSQGEVALSGPVARRLLEQVREGGLQGGAVPESIAHALSARELEVLLLLDQHLGTEEIAQRLIISEHTVRSHVKNLLGKLGVSSRREALEKLSSARG